MTLIIIAAILLISAIAAFFFITKDRLETSVAEKDLIINSLKLHVAKLEELISNSTSKSLSQEAELKKLKSEIQSLNDKMKSGTKTTSGISISGISTAAVETNTDLKKKTNKKK